MLTGWSVLWCWGQCIRNWWPLIALQSVPDAVSPTSDTAVNDAANWRCLLSDSQVTALRSGEPHPAPWDPHTHSCQLRFTWITAVSCKHDVDAHLQLLPAPVIDQLSISYEVIIRATGASLQVIVRRRWRHSCLQRLTSRPEEHLSTLAPLPVTTKTKPPNSFHKDVMLVILEVVLVFLRDPGRSLLDSFLPH